MIALTNEQGQQLKNNGEPVRVVDPTTNTEYLLIRADVYAKLQQLLEQAEDDTLQGAWADAVEQARADMVNE